MALPDGSSLLVAGTFLSRGDPRAEQAAAAGMLLDQCSPSPLGAVAYFCSFVLVCGLVVAEFVVGVIIDNLAAGFEGDGLPITPAQVEEFVQVRTCAQMCSQHALC